MEIEGLGLHLPAAEQSGKGYLEYRVLQQETQDYFQGCLFKIWFGVIYESKCGSSQSPAKRAVPVHNLSRKEHNFYTIAEDFSHHVCAMKAVASSRVSNSFFDNVFVRGYLAKLQPRHRAIYRRTLLRLLRVYVDCQNKEVGNFFVLDNPF